MIGRLRGNIIEKKPPFLLIDIHGIGYEVAVSMNTIYQLPDNNQPVTLHTHFVVREGEQSLYGFYEIQERTLFRILIKVNGVGPKLALTILSSIAPQTFIQCVRHQDIATLIKLPGVGKKTAERLVIEMRDRLPNLTATDTHTSNQHPSHHEHDQDNTSEDAISALISLGYKPQQASSAISQVYQAEHNSAELIRLALRQMAA